MTARLGARKMLRRVLLASGCALFLFIIVLAKDKELLSNLQFFADDEYGSRDIACYDEKSNIESLELFDTSLSVKRSIFFHETSCFGNSEAVLNARQACAVESAAMMNPNMTVYLLYLSPSKLSDSSKMLYDILNEYKNVKVKRVLINEYVKDTPLESWYASGILKTSYWPTSHMSDILRYLTLWKYGGIYLDLDVVVKKSLENLTNFVGAEDLIDDVAAGVMGFTNTGFGRKIATACLFDLRANFRGNIWGNNGPGVITRTLQKICRTQYIKNMTPERCKGFHVYPPATFYPIFYKEWTKYFESENLESTMELLEDAKIIHVWNKFSKHRSIRVGDKVPYAIIAEKYCPRVYRSCDSTF